MLKLLTRVFGSRNDRLLRTFSGLVSQTKVMTAGGKLPMIAAEAFASIDIA